MRVISWLAEEQLACQEGPCSMELVVPGSLITPTTGFCVRVGPGRGGGFITASEELLLSGDIKLTHWLFSCISWSRNAWDCGLSQRWFAGLRWTAAVSPTGWWWWVGKGAVAAAHSDWYPCTRSHSTSIWAERAARVPGATASRADDCTLH
jgi:hypothetical protein